MTSSKKLKINNIRSKFGISECLIDEEDYEKLSQSKWTAQKIGNNFYVMKKDKDNKSILMHRLILELDDPKKVVDHINGDTLDNRKENLRACSKSLNALNSKKWKGYYYDKRKNKWHVRIVIFQANKYFNTEQEAIEYEKEKRQKAIEILSFIEKQKS